MNSARTRLKQMLKARAIIAGISVDFPLTMLADLLGRSGFDLVFIDCEHGSTGIEKVADQVLAVRASGAASVLRPWSKDASLIRRYLDCGVDGLIYPELTSAAEVDHVRSIFRDSDPTAADELILIGLVESKEAVEGIDAIVRHSGLDGIIVGAGDLACSLGLARRSDSEQLRTAVTTCLDAAREAGQSAGVPVARFGIEMLKSNGANLFMYATKDVLREGIAHARRGLPN